MMDLKQIEKLMVAMGRAGMKKVVLKQEGFELELEKESGTVCEERPSFQRPFVPEAHAPASKLEQKAPEPIEQGRYITSPMVGTFYAASSPDHPAFVTVGDSVEPTKVVCIIEAMKVMNEVKAGTNGKIVEVLLKNGDPVEFGTKLFRIT